MRKRRRHDSLEKFEREARELLLSESEVLLHALFCSECGLCFQANLALALAGWSEQEYLDEVERRSA